jgi:hypothetical protein
MADPIVHVTLGIPDSGTGNITTLGLTIPPAGSTTSGVQGGPMAQGAVTTAAPTYTTGQVNPLSLTTAGALRIDGSGATQPVSGTFWQATQPVSGTFWQTTQPVSLVSTTITGTVAVTQSTSPWVVSNGGAFAVQLTGATNNINNISGAISLPTGAATAAKQPALGTAGSASTDVITVQGIAGGTAQPVSIAATVNVSAAQSGTWTVQQGTPPWRSVGAARSTKGVQKTSITVNTETTVVTAGAGFNDVYAIVVTNKSATAVSVDFRDATAGTVRMTLAAPANDTRGFTVAVDSAMVQAVAANNWTATVSAAVTSIEVTMLYVGN